MMEEINRDAVSAYDIADAAHTAVDRALEQVEKLAGEEPLDSYLRRVGIGYGGPHQDLLAAYDVVLAILSQHLIGMEVAVCPEVERRSAGGPSLVRRHLARARSMENTVRSIEQLLWGDAQAPSRRLDELHSQLLDLMAAHRREEEHMLRTLDQTMDATEESALAVRLQRATSRAPSRPHPHAPRRTGWSRLLYRPIGVWDLILDRLDSRTRVAWEARRRRVPGLWGSYLLGRPLPAQRPPQEASSTESRRSGSVS